MNKKEIKSLLKKYYSELSESNIHSYLSEVYRNENNEIIKIIIKEHIYKGKSNKELVELLPVSESDYYRLKNQLIDKIYHLLILDNKVTRNEILND